MQKMKKLALFLAGIFCFGLFSCGKKGEGEITVYMPDGAPAIALAHMMAKGEEGIDYQVVAPATIASRVTYREEDKNADLCVLPITAASKLLGAGDRYALLGIVTHGNLYFLSKDMEKIDDLSVLTGKKIGVLQINEVPGLTLKSLLKRQGIAYLETTNEGEYSQTAVNLQAVAAGELKGEATLLAEPAATAMSKNGYKIVGDLQALYGGGYPQAALVVKKSLLAEREEWVKAFVEEVKDTAWLNGASGQQIVNVVQENLEDATTSTSLKAPLLTKEVVARCGVVFSYAKESKGEIESFLWGVMEINPQAAAIPNENFYWG